MLIELKKGSKFNNIPVLISSLEVKQGKNGNDYIDFSLMDSSTTINAKMWNTTCINATEGDVILISGKVDEYNGTLQLILNVCEKTDSIRKEELYRKSVYDKDNLWKTIEDFVNRIKDADMKKLVVTVFEKYKEVFETHPAAKTVHHNYLHGLLEHTLFTTYNALALGQNYTFINMDLLITGALLHDIGKLEELTEMPAIDYTVTGDLLGHISIGALMLSKEMDALGICKDKHDKLIHCILAHHGKLEYGSPKLPSLPEALIINLADDCDSKMKIFEEAIKNKEEKRNYFLEVIPRSGIFNGELNFM